MEVGFERTSYLKLDDGAEDWSLLAVIIISTSSISSITDNDTILCERGTFCVCMCILYCSPRLMAGVTEKVKEITRYSGRLPSTQSYK